MLNPFEIRVQVHEYFSAAADIEAAANAAHKRHRHSLRLILFLSLATAVIVFTMTLRTWSWHSAMGFAIALSILTFALLLWRSLDSWSKQHPLLADFRLCEMQIKASPEIRYSEDAIQLYVDIVREYCPKTETQELLGRLNKAKR